MLLFIPLSLSAAQKQDSSVKTFPPVKVMAGRLYSNPSMKFLPVTLIDKSDIDDAAAVQLTDVLSRVPGLTIKDYGGIGGLKTISIRGTSANQTLVMIDGMRLSSSQSGVFDFGTFPLSSVSGIEVARGGASALFGGNAIGGVINIITSVEQDYTMRLNSGFGSFADRKLDLTATGKIFGAPVSAQLNYLYTKGDYPFEFVEFGKKITAKRDNGEFTNLSATLAGIIPDEDWNLKYRAMYRNSDRGIPGAALQGHIESPNAALGEQESILLLSGSRQLDSASQVSIGTLLRINSFRYVDPDALGFGSRGIDSYFLNSDMQLTAKYSSIFSDFTFGDITFGDIKYEIGFEGSFADLRGDMLQPETGDYVYRSSASVFGRAETGGIDISIGRAAFNFGARADYLSDMTSSATSPLAGFILLIDDLPLKISTQYSYNFRPPSFNEMYYLNYGSADLVPERSHSVNIGAEYYPLANMTLGGELFMINTTNQIVSVPKSPVAWTAENIGNVLTQGIECSASIRLFGDMLNLELAYTRQIALDKSDGSLTYNKQVPYIPQEVLFLTSAVKYKNALSGVSIQYSSYRYALFANNYSSMLPRFMLIDVFLSYRFNFIGNRLVLRLNADNIFEEKYELVKKYPMPGISFRAGLSLQI